MSESLQSLLNAARQLSPEQQRLLATQLLAEVEESEPVGSETTRIHRALAIVEATYGSIKGLDRATLERLAKDEEFSGY